MVLFSNLQIKVVCFYSEKHVHSNIILSNKAEECKGGAPK
jgi:hypothetical protein